jgi:2-hydroxychromene-2-carboxylate isomerase
MTNTDRVYIDFKSPYAYIAIKAIYAIEDDLNIQFDWLPFTLDIASFAGSAKVDDKGEVVVSNRSEKQWTRVKYAYQDVRRYAKFLGLDFKAPHKIWDSSLAAIGLLWAKQQGQIAMRAYIDATFTRFWQRDLDIEDVNMIVSMLEQAGVDTSGFMHYFQTDGRALHDQIQQQAREMKIFGVPSFVIKGEWYWGREHIPYIRYLLGDSNPEIMSTRLAGVSTLS